MALLESEEYVEAGYFADADYVGGIAEAVVGISPYVVEDYIEAGYFVPGGSFASLTATLELAIQFAEATINSTTGLNISVVKIKQFSSTMSSEFTAAHVEGGGFDLGFNVDVGFVGEAVFTATSTMSVSPSKILSANANIAAAFNTVMTVVSTMSGETLMQNVITMSTNAELIADSSGLLEYFANLNAQGDATRTVGATINSEVGLSSFAGVSYQGASEVVSTSSLTSVVDSVIFNDSTTINSVSGLTANAIEYQLRANPYNRPINFTHSTNRIPGTTGGVEGGYIAANPGEIISSDALGADLPDTFLLMFNYKTYWQDTDAEMMTYGDPSSPVIRVRRDSPGSGNRLEVIFASNTGNRTVVLTDTDSRLFNLNTVQWVTIFIHRYNDVNNNTTTRVKVIVDGDIEKSQNVASNIVGTLNLPSSANRKFIFNNTPTASGVQIDDFMLFDRDTTSNYGWGLDKDVANNYTQPPNAEDAIMYHRFNGDYIDESSLTFEGNTSVTTVSTSNIDVTKLVDADADITANISLNSVVGRIRSDSSSMSSAFGSSANALRIKSTDASLACEFNSNIDENYIRGATSTPSVIAEISIQAGVVFQGLIVADSIASSLTAAGRVGDYFANADVSTTLTSAVVVVRGGNSTLNSSTTTTPAPNYIRGATLTVAAVVSLASSLVTIKDHSATGNSVSDLTANPGKITQGNGSVNSVSSLSCDASRLSVEVANFGSNFDINSVANVNASGAAELTVNSATTALAGVAYEASVEMSGFTAIISINKILHVDQYIYTVPKESRVWSIPKETRSHVIDRELRSYSIKGT